MHRLNQIQVVAAQCSLAEKKSVAASLNLSGVGQNCIEGSGDIRIPSGCEQMDIPELVPAANDPHLQSGDFC